MKRLDLTGHRFGRLVVTDYEPETRRWACICDCGDVATVPGGSLRGGRTASCGCYRRERGREHGATINRRHGEGSNGKETPEYTAWAQMLTRCRNPLDARYSDYGARGIVVCERWFAYEHFLADMGRRPGPGYSIDRRDNAGNYEPVNCRWATSQEKNNNTRGNHHLTARGETRTLGRAHV